MNKRFYCFASLLILGISVAQAQIYKWVDDNGQVHYSEKAPDRKYAAKEIHLHKHVLQTIMTTPKQRKQKRNNLLRAFDEERKLRKDARILKDRKDSRRRHNCILARDKLKNYQRATVVYNLDAKGKRIYLSDSQRSRAEGSLKNKINRWCH